MGSVSLVASHCGGSRVFSRRVCLVCNWWETVQTLRAQLVFQFMQLYFTSEWVVRNVTNSPQSAAQLTLDFGTERSHDDVSQHCQLMYCCLG